MSRQPLGEAGASISPVLWGKKGIQGGDVELDSHPGCADVQGVLALDSSIFNTKTSFLLNHAMADLPWGHGICALWSQTFINT